MTNQDRQELLDRGIDLDQINRLDARNTAVSAANLNPLPGPLAAAFSRKEKVVVAGMAFRPPEMGDVILLQCIGSPIHKILADMGSETTEEPVFKLEQIYDLVYLWTHDFEHCNSVIRSGDRSGWRLTVDDWVIASRLPLGAVFQFAVAIRKNIDQAFSTATTWEADKATGETVFTQPPAERRTGPAGGSI